MKYKGSYSARVIITVEHEVEENMLPFEEVKDNFENGLTGALQSLLEDNLGMGADVEVLKIRSYLCREDS